MLTLPHPSKWMNIKLYNKEDPGPNDRPLNGSHHTLDYYKKSISYFMPSKELSWNEVYKSGNPTKCKEVNDAIKRVREFDSEASGSAPKKRKSSGAKMARPVAPVATQRPPAVPPMSRDGLAMQGMLRTMHAQNASFIDLFGVLSRSLDQFKTTLQSNNNQINAILANYSQMPTLFAPPSDITQPNVATVSTGMLDWQYVHADGVRRRVPP